MQVVVDRTMEPAGAAFVCSSVSSGYDARGHGCSTVPNGTVLYRSTLRQLLIHLGIESGSPYRPPPQWGRLSSASAITHPQRVSKFSSWFLQVTFHRVCSRRPGVLCHYRQRRPDGTATGISWCGCSSWGKRFPRAQSSRGVEGRSTVRRYELRGLQREALG